MIKVKAKTKLDGNILVNETSKNADSLEVCTIILHLFDTLKKENGFLQTDEDIFNFLKLFRKESEVLNDK